MTHVLDPTRDQYVHTCKAEDDVYCCHWENTDFLVGEMCYFKVIRGD